MKNKEESINLKKINLTANILFSGIGCQERGFENSGLFDIEVLNTSDINKESVLSYAAIHCGMTNQMVDEYANYPSKEEMAQHLTDINLGYEPEKNKYFDWFKLVKRKKNDLEKYWLACKLTNNLGDISRIDELPYADFWTCSFPCTDISVAGKMKGLNPDTNTRSSLLWDNIKLLNIAKDKNTLPKYIMFENVKNLVSKKFIDDFNNLIDVLGELGFNTYWSVINGKDCGIPQNRERVFVIAIRKDIDTENFTFPKPFDTGIRLKDVLEEEVDDKYYMSDTALRKFKLFDTSKGTDIKVAGSINPDKNVQDRVRVLDTEGISQGLRATDYKDPVKITVGIDKSANNTNIIEYANCITSREDRGVSNYEGIGTAILENKIYPIGSISDSQDGIVVSPDGISKTHTAGHNNCPKIIETGKLEQIGQLYGTDKEPNPQAGRVYDKEYLSPTIDSCSGGNRMPKIADVARMQLFREINNMDCNLFDYINSIIVCLDLINMLEEGEDKNGNEYKKCREILYVLWEEISKEKIQWKTRGFCSISEKKILQPRLYGTIQTDATESRCNMEDCTSNSTEDKRKNIKKKKLRDLWKIWKDRCTSYKLELERQFIEEFTGFMSGLSQQNSQNQECMLDMWATNERTRLLQQALLEIQDIWVSINDKEKEKVSKLYPYDRATKNMCNIRVRKLTPRETWKLMGLTFEDCDKAATLGVADTHLYKQAGNGIITNCCELLAEHLYKAQYDNTYICTDERYQENFTRPQVG